MDINTVDFEVVVDAIFSAYLQRSVQSAMRPGAMIRKAPAHWATETDSAEVNKLRAIVAMRQLMGKHFDMDPEASDRAEDVISTSVACGYRQAKGEPFTMLEAVLHIERLWYDVGVLDMTGVSMQKVSQDLYAKLSFRHPMALLNGTPATPEEASEMANLMCITGFEVGKKLALYQADADVLEGILAASEEQK